MSDPGLKNHTKSHGRIVNSEHVDISRARRVVLGGGVPESFYATTTAKKVGKYKTLRVVNTDTDNFHFIAVGASTLGVPTISTGIVLAPGLETYISTGINVYFRTSSALVQVVVMKDNE